MSVYDKERIEKLRLPALQKKIDDYREFTYHFYDHFVTTFNTASFEERYAEALYHSFDQTEVVIDEGELIVGKIANREFTQVEQQRWESIRQYAIPAGSSYFGQGSHMSIDYPLLLSQGISGIISRIETLRTRLDLTAANDLNKDTYYKACIRSLEGVVRISRRYAQCALEKAKDAPEPYRSELSRIAQICERVPEFPAGSFYEAVQSVHFLTFCLSNKPQLPGTHQYQLGRPDRYLLPYYEKDIENGKITEDEVQTLLDCLGIMINHRVPHGLSSGYMVGGKDENGKVVSNPLTNMLMRVVEHDRLVYPAVGLCWCPETPEEDFSLACEILGKGFSHPAIFNDDVISRGLRARGLSEAESHSYIHSTCVEITPIASSNVWVASPYHNLMQMLLDCLEKDYSDIDALMEAFFQKVSCAIKEQFMIQNGYRLERAKYTIDPLLSCFVNDCLEKGLDIESGGARYNWIMPSFVGLSNVADALSVIDSLVLHDKTISFETLRQMLAANFVGFEQQYRKILDFKEKYGNDCDAADRYVQKITQWLTAECRKYTACFDGALVPSLFCWIMHDILGGQTGASPDGRKSGFPLGDGSGPAQGRELKGPTASVISSTKWEHAGFIGGVAVNMKFSKKFFKPESLPKMKALIKTYLKRGGFEMQINVVDRDTLLKAQRDPDSYRDLIVRIGGYSDYFVKLSPSMQAEVIIRTEHEL